MLLQRYRKGHSCGTCLCGKGSSKSTPVAVALAERRLFIALGILCEMQRVPEKQGNHALERTLWTSLIGLTFDCPASISEIARRVLTSIYPQAA